MNNSENDFLLISACCPNHAGNDGRKFIGPNAVTAALALPPARGQDSTKPARNRAKDE
jgi:hypothetical protein